LAGQGARSFGEVGRTWGPPNLGRSIGSRQGEDTVPTLFWTGTMSLPLKLVVNVGSLIAWVTGNAQDTSAMKQRIKNGYNGKYSDYVHRYDELGSSNYKKISRKLIEKVNCKGKEVIDVGCGTGIFSLMALENGASKVNCVDMSTLMLEKCKAKIIAEGYSEELIEFHEAEAERLPFDDGCFDVVALNMVLGMIPDQQATIKELARVLRPNGIVALATHGPGLYREAIDAGLKVMTMRYFLSHRFELWQRDESEVQDLLINAGLKDVHTERLTWIDEFETGRDAFDFFASVSSLWWYDRLPPNLREKETEKTREYFQRKQIKSITSDVVLAYGSKG
jgi:ubiquinone/menaquinone biosynthesis C-methylase UbiE